MPKLLLFAPCEKLIVDEERNPTLVCVLQDINVEVGEGSNVPANAVIPKEWDIVTLFGAGEGESKKEYIQKIRVFSPLGKQTVESSIDVNFQGKPRFQGKIHVNGIPIGAAGVYVLKLWLLEKGTTAEGDPIAEYPLKIIHKFVKAAAQLEPSDIQVS